MIVYKALDCAEGLPVETKDDEEETNDKEDTEENTEKDAESE